jgi:TetR/AcrR family transcriptional regulator, cholesterol catabolism regulator
MTTDGTVAPVKRPPGRPRSGPDPARFKQIVDAAAELFRTKGYSATSIQDIADATGLLKGSLYHYVDSKEDFLYHIVQGVYRDAVEDVQRVVELDAKPEERFAAFVRSHVMFTTTHLTAYTVRLREFHHLSDERRAEIRRGGEAYLDLLTDILEKGRKSGVFTDDLDLDVIVRIILGQLNAITRWYRSDSELDPEELADALVSLTASAVVSDKGIKAYKGIESLRAHVREVQI